MADKYERFASDKERIEAERRWYSQYGDELLGAFTPENYEGERPPYFNVQRIGSVVRITMRGAMLHDGSGGETAVAVVNAWTLNEIAKMFAQAANPVLSQGIDCDHNWLSADNERVSGVSVCTKCRMIARSSHTQESKT